MATQISGGWFDAIDDEATHLVNMAMLAADCTRADLARKLGVTNAAVSHRLTHTGNLRALAESLHVLGYRLRLTAEPYTPGLPVPSCAGTCRCAGHARPGYGEDRGRMTINVPPDTMAHIEHLAARAHLRPSQWAREVILDSLALAES